VLAPEYDRAEHGTTRILEALSREALAQAYEQAPEHHEIERILEVGAGTGALTRALLDTWPRAHALATDRSHEMLAVLDDKLGTVHTRLSTTHAEVSGVREVCDPAPDLIAAGLADPFLDASTLETLREISAAGTRLFVTVPSRRWAVRERTTRLGIPVDSTRFRLLDGSVVFAKSLTYDEEELRTLLAEAGFASVVTGTECSQSMWSRPEVCWTLARAV